MPEENSSNKRPRRYVVGLIALHLVLTLAGLAMFSAGFEGYKWPRWQCVYVEGVTFGQVGLVAAILVVGDMRLSVRIVGFGIVVTFWLLVLNDLGLDHEYWLGIFAIQVAGICSCLAIVRIFGVRMIRDDTPADEPIEKAKYGFSLQQMFYLTAAVSFLLCLGLVAAKFLTVPQSIDWGILPRTKTLGPSLIPIMLAAVWAALGAKRRIIPVASLVLITGLAALAIANTDRLTRNTWWSALTHESYQTAYMYLAVVYAAIVYLSLAVLRVAGFRLGRFSRPRSSAN